MLIFQSEVCLYTVWLLCFNVYPSKVYAHTTQSEKGMVVSSTSQLSGAQARHWTSCSEIPGKSLASQGPQHTQAAVCPAVSGFHGWACTEGVLSKAAICCQLWHEIDDDRWRSNLFIKTWDGSITVLPFHIGGLRSCKERRCLLFHSDNFLVILDFLGGHGHPKKVQSSLLQRSFTEVGVSPKRMMTLTPCPSVGHQGLTPSWPPGKGSPARAAFPKVHSDFAPCSSKKSHLVQSFENSPRGL